MRRFTLHKIYSYLIATLIFLVPSNLFFKIYESTAYVNGQLIDYLIPKFYLSDIVVLTLIGLWILKTAHLPKIKISLFLVAVATLIARQFFVTHQLATAWYVLKLFELTVFFLFISKNRSVLKANIVTWSIIITIVFQSLLAIFQFHTQHSLVGYPLLGEPSIPQALGLATTVTNGVEKIEPYGTTAHPNVLGGILSAYILFLLFSFKEDERQAVRLTKVAAMILGLYAIFLTHSFSALLMLALGITILVLRKKIYWQNALTVVAVVLVITPLIIGLMGKKYSNEPSLSRRKVLQENAISIFLNNPITGVGLNQFTTQTNHFNKSKELVRFVQPVHHAGMLWLAETGLLGVVFVALLIKKIPMRKYSIPLLVLTPIAVLDHYLLTQQSGLLLTAFALIFLNKSLTTR